MRSNSFSGKLGILPKTILPLLLTTVFSAPVVADPAMEWIQKMSDAMRNLNYRGNFVYMHGNQLESMQISHIRDANGEKETGVWDNGALATSDNTPPEAEPSEGTDSGG